MESRPNNTDGAEPKTDSIFTEEEFSMQGYDKNIRQARNAIFWVAAILLINFLILFFSLPDDYEFLWLEIAIWGTFILGFVFLGFYSKKKPYNAIVIALALYAVFIIFNAILDIHTIYRGIIFKVISIIFLVKGLRDAKEAQEMQKHFQRNA
jgi:hypothetical protein